MGRAVNEGLPEGVMFGLSDEHEVGEIQVPGAKGIGKDKERIEVSVGTGDTRPGQVASNALCEGTARPRGSGNPLSGGGVMVTFPTCEGHSGCSIENG